MFLNKSMSSHKNVAIINELCNSKFKLTSVNNYLLLVKICILVAVLNEVSSGPAKLTLYKGSKRYQTNTPQCKAGVYLVKPGIYTCACVTGLWGFYETYCSKPITIAGGDNYCFQLREFTIAQVVPFGNPQNPFEPSLNVFNADFHSFKHFFLEKAVTHFSTKSSFLIVTDEPWTLYGNKGSKSICLKPIVQGRRKFCLFSRRPPLKIRTILNSWRFVNTVSKGCNSTLVWRADSCTDILAPNDFAECAKRSPKDDDEEEETIHAPISTTSEKPRFKWIDGWLKIQPAPKDPRKSDKGFQIFEDYDDQRKVIGWIPIQPRNSNLSNTTEVSTDTTDEGWIKIQPKYQTTPIPTGNLSSEEERWIKIPLRKKIPGGDAQNLSSSEERWIKIPLKTKTPKEGEQNSSSEERWIKIPPKTKTPKEGEQNSSSEERWIKIYPKTKTPKEGKQNLTSSKGRSIKTPPKKKIPIEDAQKLSSSEERWIQIQPMKQPTSKPIDSNALSSEERWIKIPPKSPESTSSAITTTETPSEPTSEERWIKIQPRTQESTTTSTTTTDTPFESTSAEKWIKIQPRIPESTSPSAITITETPFESSSDERWIKIQPRTQESITTSTATTSSPLESSSEERWVKIQRRTQESTTTSTATTGTPLESSSEERWIKIPPRYQNITVPIGDLSSEERWIKIAPRQKTPIEDEKNSSVSSEERWIKIQPRKQPVSKTIDYNSLSEERWIKIQPITQESTSSASTTSTDTPFESSSEERWIKIQPRTQESTSSSPTTTTDTPFESSSEEEERWIRIQPNKRPIPNSTTNFSSESEERWIKIKSGKKATSKPPLFSESEERWIKIQPRIKPKAKVGSSSEKGWIQIQPRNRKVSPYTITESPFESSSSEEKWIMIRKGGNYMHTTTSSTTSVVSKKPVVTPEPEPIDVEIDCAGTGFSGLTRSKVKDYWLDPYSTACARSINEAVFTDQLRRFTTKQFDRLFPSRLRSLIDVELMLNYTKQIMQKTCPNEFVPNEFFEVALQAVVMFLQEDFFYGVEGAHPEAFKRIIHSLKVCLETAKPFVFEYDELDCGIKKINGWIILPGKHEKLEVPKSYAYKGFEPLIETTWKMFLNSHSLCFPHFKVSNDHHHFSKLVMEVFSQTIYEKWIEPIEFFDLYEFILPNYHFLHETMQNVDYCVAAVSKVSTCPVWMSRTGVQSEVASSSRKKRNVWMGPNNSTPSKDVWDGEGICLQNNTDAETIFSLKSCT